MAAIFDMDGLLFDTDPRLWLESMTEVAQHYGIDVSPDLLKFTRGLRIYEVTEFWARRFQFSDPALPRTIAEGIIDNIIERSMRKGKIMPGVSSLLEDLSAHKVKMGVATSSPMRMCARLLQHFELHHFFDAVVSADSCTAGKPHPEVYLQCAQQLGVPAFECVAFEDSVNGMVAAKAARMKLVAVPEPQQKDNPAFGLADLLLNNLKEMKSSDYFQLIEQ